MRKYKLCQHFTLTIICLILLGIASCKQSTTPKPKGYFRIDLPQKSYQSYDNKDCPYTFQFPMYARVLPDQSKRTEPCWVNVDFPQFHAKIHLSYKEIQHNLNTYAEESRTFAYKHTVKATAINEKLINNKNNVHGILYEIGGNTASSLQFYVTDSTRHFIRGALYFYAEPNADSISPVLEFVRKDVTELINSLQWRDEFSAHGSGGKRK